MKHFVNLLIVCMFFIATAIAAEKGKNPLDAPEAAFWHAGSRMWLVSNLGGGISLARDGIGWLV